MVRRGNLARFNSLLNFNIIGSMSSIFSCIPCTLCLSMAFCLMLLDVKSPFFFFLIELCQVNSALIFSYGKSVPMAATRLKGGSASLGKSILKSVRPAEHF